MRYQNKMGSSWPSYEGRPTLFRMDVMMRRYCKWRQSHQNLFSCMSPMIPRTAVAVEWSRRRLDSRPTLGRSLMEGSFHRRRKRVRVVGARKEVCRRGGSVAQPSPLVYRTETMYLNTNPFSDPYILRTLMISSCRDETRQHLLSPRKKITESLYEC